MRTYRWILIAGLALLIAGWLAGVLLVGPDGVPPRAVGLVRSVGQLLAVIGAAGMIMIVLVRRLMIRRMGPPDNGGGD